MIKISGMSKSYKTEVVQTRALNEISLSVDSGDFVVITGPSGSGKSTLLNIIGMLETHDDGAYVLDGQNLTDLNDKARSKIRNEKIGMIFQAFNLLPELNLYDNVALPLRLRKMSGSELDKQVKEALDTVGLGGRLKHLPSQLSGGQQQRVAIARAIAGNPKILLADEPTGNLDSEMSSAVMDLIKGLNKAGTTVVMVTHDKDIANNAQKRIEILDGKVVVGEAA